MQNRTKRSKVMCFAHHPATSAIIAWLSENPMENAVAERIGNHVERD